MIGAALHSSARPVPVHRPEIRPLGPRRFPQRGLLGKAPKVVIWKHAHTRKIQLARKPPHYLVGSFAQTFAGSVIRQHDAKKNRRLAAPVLGDLIADAHYVWPCDLPDTPNRRFDFRLFCDRRGYVHCHLILAQKTLLSTQADPVSRRHLVDLPLVTSSIALEVDRRGVGGGCSG